MDETIRNIIASGADISITVRASDLRDALFSLFEQFRDDTDRRAAAKTAEAGKTEDLLDRKEVMARLRCCPAKLWEMQRSGELKPVCIGRRVFFLKKDVEALIKYDPAWEMTAEENKRINKTGHGK